MDIFPLGTLYAVYGSPNRAIAAGIGLATPIFSLDQPLVAEIASAPRALHWGGEKLPYGPGKPAFVAGALFGTTSPARGVFWAVGSVLENNASFTRNMILRRRDQVWEHIPCPSLDLNPGDGTVVPTEFAQTSDNRLNGVSGTAANDVWAVGTVDPGNGVPYEPYGSILHWNGASWTLMPLIDSGPMQELHGVVAVAGFPVYAVGDRQLKDGYIHTYILEYDGTAWNVVISEDGPGSPRDSRLLSVAANGGRAWAVGYYFDGATNMRRALILRRESTVAGVIWKRDAANLAATGGLKAVSASSTSNAWAIGDGPVVMHWDGVNWRVLQGGAFREVVLPLDSLEGVHAAADDDVWIVGSRQSSAPPPKGAQGAFGDRVPLAIHWNGSNWKTHAGAVA